MDDIPTEARALLAVAPDDFVQERQRLVHELREEGRRVDAATVAKLRKPAPVVLAANRAARDRPKAAKAAARAAGRVRKAQLRSDPAAYRDAVAELEDSLNLLAEVALAHLTRKGKPPSESTRRRLRELLRNAVAEDEARETLARGVLREEPETEGSPRLPASRRARPTKRGRQPLPALGRSVTTGCANANARCGRSSPWRRASSTKQGAENGGQNVTDKARSAPWRRLDLSPIASRETIS